MKKYKYKTFKDVLSDQQLNELGERGWELVFHTALYVPNNRRNPVQYYVFKKEKTE